MRTLLALLLMTGTLAAETLVVMSYNVRYPNPNDGVNVWENRRDMLVEVIRHYGPDIIGTQELFKLQGDYIAANLPEYKWFGRDRRGGDEDEHMGVFYKPSKLELLEEGDFWLSETPDVAGSMDWHVSLPRMVTWARFRSAGKEFYFLNTHFPHRREDDAARLNCAEVIQRFIRGKIPAGADVIMTGDFNAPAGGEVFELLTEDLKDSRDNARLVLGPEPTSNGWSPRWEGRRIDWILYRGPWTVSWAKTLTASFDGRFPSDHYPVLAILER
jgi:endonuclease/exonuclease/phosphatase family metal-dependent hydrolase